MKYKITRNQKYDFVGQSYLDIYPNLHKYPATMIPQIGINILKELGINKGKLLDPYCGSGSSFISAIDCGISEMEGFDINPLAILISKAKFTKIDINKIKFFKQEIRNLIYEFVKKEENLRKIQIPEFYNIKFWFSENVIQSLSIIKYFLEKIKDKDIKRFFLVPFSETIRECSYTRNNEFKLYRIKSEEILNFNPDVFAVYFNKLNKAIDIYQNYYFSKLNKLKIKINNSEFKKRKNHYNVVLTSPPYGDSKTTVAYGQFSTLSNEWLGISYARQIDKMLMGGKSTKEIHNKGIISQYINDIGKISHKRALEVSSFYNDLQNSIFQIAESIKKNGKVIYIVGNRRVKNIQLPTDQFIAEKFEEKGLKHLFTYERILGNKSMPLKNSPTNEKNKKSETMTKEYIIVCEK